MPTCSSPARRSRRASRRPTRGCARRSTTAEARGAELVSEVGLFLRLTRARIVAVTGTKGKTTTASLVAAMLERAPSPGVLGGNIGTPLIERVRRARPDDWAVLELSELQLPTIDRGATSRCTRTSAQDHLDRHGSVEAYRAVKARLAELRSGRPGIVLNADDPGCRELGERLPAASLRLVRLRRPGAGPSVGRLEDGWITVAGSVLPAAGRCRFPVATCSPTSSALRSPPTSWAAAAVPMAGAIRGLRRGAASARDGRGAGRRALGERLAGDDPGRGRSPRSRPSMRRSCSSPAGRTRGSTSAASPTRSRGGPVLRADRRDGGGARALIAGRVPVRRAGSMDEAVRRRLARAPGDVVLLSPAAASFDMFIDYAARGDAFRAAVAALGGAA
jgi:UDP-N-acetylmuramoylalanine--D-glutamate ligase